MAMLRQKRYKQKLFSSFSFLQILSHLFQNQRAVSNSPPHSAGTLSLPLLTINHVQQANKDQGTAGIRTDRAGGCSDGMGAHIQEQSIHCIERWFYQHQRTSGIDTWRFQ